MSDLKRFHTLCDLQLITPALRDKVLRDPRLDESKAYPGLANALLWLVVRQLLSEEELATVGSRLRAPLSLEAQEERQTVLAEAQANLRIVKHKRNRKALERLHTEGLITASQRDIAASRLPDDERCATPAAALTWAIVNRHVPAEEFEALERRQDGLGATARGIVQDTRKNLTALHRELSADVWQRAFPGPRWAWLAGAGLFVAGAVWMAVPSRGTPDCDAKEVRATVSGMLFKKSLGSLGALGTGSPLGKGGIVLPKDFRSVGYDSKTAVRGCTCTFDLFGMAMPFAFTIEPLAEAGEFNVVRADPDELEARFAPPKAEAPPEGR